MGFTPESKNSYSKQSAKWIIGVIVVAIIAVIIYLNFKSDIIAKGDLGNFRSIAGKECSISVNEASYVFGILTIDLTVVCNFTDEEFQEIFKNGTMEPAMADAVLAGVVKGLLESNVFLENKNGIQRKPLGFNVKAHSEFKSASIEVVFEADDREEYTFNIQSYPVDPMKRLEGKAIKYSLK